MVTEPLKNPPNPKTLIPTPKKNIVQTSGEIQPKSPPISVHFPLQNNLNHCFPQPPRHRLLPDMVQISRSRPAAATSTLLSSLDLDPNCCRAFAPTRRPSLSPVVLSTPCSPLSRLLTSLPPSLYLDIEPRAPLHRTPPPLHLALVLLAKLSPLFLLASTTLNHPSRLLPVVIAIASFYHRSRQPAATTGDNCRFQRCHC